MSTTTKHEPGEWIEWQGVDGHRWGNHADSTGRVWTWNAQHLDDCACSDPERWY